MRLRILDRMVLGTFLRLFVAFLFGAPLLIILADATENLDSYLDGGVPFSDAVISYVYQYPQFMSWAFPVAALLATVFTIHPMTTHREIMAAKAGGVSFYRLVAPLLLAGVVLTGAGLVVADVAPRTTKVASEMRGEYSASQGFRTNFVYITDTGASLTVRRLSVDEGRMYDVSLQELPRERDQPTQYLQAEQARWWEGEGWYFQAGSARTIYPDGQQVTYNFGDVLVRTLTERPADLVEQVREEDQMTYEELRLFGERLQRSGGDVGRTYTKMEQRLAIPVATLVIMLFGAPLATSSKRGGAAFGVGVSLATTILYVMLLRFTGALGYAGTLSPLLAAWIPNGIFLAAGLVLMSRVRT